MCVCVCVCVCVYIYACIYIYACMYAGGLTSLPQHISEALGGGSVLCDARRIRTSMRRALRGQAPTAEPMRSTEQLAHSLRKRRGHRRTSAAPTAAARAPHPSQEYSVIDTYTSMYSSNTLANHSAHREEGLLWCLVSAVLLSYKKVGRFKIVILPRQFGKSVRLLMY